MKIFVTGCLGYVGRIAVPGLLKAGHEVVGVDLVEGSIPEGMEFHRGSVRDPGFLKKAMAGCDVVIHLAGYRMPHSAREEEIFDLNAGGTFYVFKACQENGIDQLIVASSPNIVGYNFAIEPGEIVRLPIEEDHPCYTTDIYSYSKECMESIGDYFYRRYRINSVFLRFGLDFTKTAESWMVETEGPAELRMLRSLLEEWAALPPGEAKERLLETEQRINRKRREAFEGEPYQNGMEYIYDHFDDFERIWNYYVHNFLMFLDCRDMARAFVCAVEHPVKGTHGIFIADHKNMLGMESAEIARLCYPSAQICQEKLVGCDALVDYRAAKELIGFEAEHSFADFYASLYGKGGSDV